MPHPGNRKSIYQEETCLMRKLLIIASLLTLLLNAVAQSAQPGTKEQPVAIIQTSMGNLTCVLFPKAAPVGTASFIGLAKGTKDWSNPKTGKMMHGVPLYDSTTFHRVIPEFMIQGGDPAGTGSGDVGFQFKNETLPNLTFDRPGRLAYANAGPNTNGSQFYVTEVPTPFLNGKYTIFGQCDDASVELVKKIARQPRNGQDKPLTAIVIKHIKIDEGTKAQSPAKKVTTTAAKSAAH
jgi:peptidyl-prolyl cis-trans isomerase A (cyclophilin A)